MLKKVAIGAACVVLSIISGLFLMVPLAWVFDTMRWPEFNKWALAHGGWVVAWPTLTLFSLAVIWTLVRRLRQRW